MDQDTNAGNMTCSQKMVDTMRATRRWVRFISILALVGFGVYLILVVYQYARLSGTSAFPLMAYYPFGMIFLSIMAMVVIYVLPATLLLTYVARINAFIKEARSDALETALESQKTFWKYIGIVAIIFLVIAGMAGLTRLTNQP